jgi:serine/threonine-protein kinase
VFERLDATSKWDVCLLPVEGDSTPRVVVRSPANDLSARLSPDGRWVAFTSDETGVPETYVQPVGSTGLKYQVTTGGSGPWYWSRDGRSLVFQRLDRTGLLFRADVLAAEEFSLGAPRAFMRFPEDYVYAFPAPDEKRFLVLLPAEKPEQQTITVLQNWQAALREE